VTSHYCEDCDFFEEFALVAAEEVLDVAVVEVLLDAVAAAGSFFGTLDSVLFDAGSELFEPARESVR